MGAVSLWVYAPSGGLQQDGVNLPSSRVEWRLEENTYGVLTATGPLSEVNPNIFQLDAQFSLRRTIDGVNFYREGDTAFLLRYWSFGEDENGVQTWSIEAYTPEYVLTGRIVDSWASDETTTNPLTTKSGAADDIIKELVTENMVSASEASRNIAILTVEADTSSGASTSKGCAWANLYNTILDICEDSGNQGTYLSYALLLDPANKTLTFRTWAGQRGADHRQGSGDSVIVSKSRGNLRAPVIETDHRAEVNAVRVGGRGQGQARLTARVVDTERYSASPFAYREDFFNGNMQAESANTLAAAGRSELERGRPVRTFRGSMVDTAYARYGERVRFGDLVTAEYLGYTFDCRLYRVVGVWDGTETLTMDLVGVEAI